MILLCFVATKAAVERIYWFFFFFSMEDSVATFCFRFCFQELFIVDSPSKELFSEMLEKLASRVFKTSFSKDAVKQS